MTKFQILQALYVFLDGEYRRFSDRSEGYTAFLDSIRPAEDGSGDMSADPAAAEEFLRIAGDIFDGDECSPEEGWYYASRYLFELSWSGRDIDEVLAEFSACTEQQWEEIVSGLGAGGKYRCPCCGEYSLDEPPGKYDICSVCGWEDDPVQLKDPDFAGGANRLSLNEARAEYIGKKTK